MVIALIMLTACNIVSSLNYLDYISVPVNVRQACVFDHKLYYENTTITVTSQSQIECVMHCIYQQGCVAGVFDQITFAHALKQKVETNEEMLNFFGSNTNISFAYLTIELSNKT